MPETTYFDNTGDENDRVLPKHMRCGAHTINLVCVKDSDDARKQRASYKQFYQSAFGKAQGLWNKQSRQVSDYIWCAFDCIV